MPGRNDPCPCGSGKKYKKCCADKTKDILAGQRINNLDSAISCFESGQFPAAINAAQSFLRHYPKEPVAYQILGVSLYYLGRFSQAEQAFLKLLKLDKKNADALNNLALVLYEQGKLDKAEKYCQQAIHLAPNMAAAHNNLGNIYRAQLATELAFECYRKAISLGMHTPQVYCNLGSVLQEQGDITLAIENYEKSLQIEPRFSAAYNNLGALYTQEGELDKAKASLDRALELLPDDAEVLSNMGNYWLESEDVQQAESCYIKAVALQPENTEVNYRLGHFYRELGKNEQGRACFKKVLGINPQHARALAALGEIQLMQMQHELAASTFAKAIKYGEHDVVVVRSYCLYLLKQRQYQEALSRWQKLDQLYPGRWSIQHGIAEYYKEIGDYQQAKSCFSKLAEAYPDDTSILYRLADLEESHHHLDNAIELAKRILAIKPDHTFARLVLIRALTRNKQYEQALAEIDLFDVRKVETDPQRWYSILFEKGAILDRLKRYDEAYDYFVEASELKNKVMGTGYDYAGHVDNFNKLRHVFSSENIARIPHYTGKDSSQVSPVFIVGFPRSGTTLLEQILASHSAVSAGDELLFIGEIKNKLNEFTGSQIDYPLNILDEKAPVTQDRLQQMRQYYFDRVHEQGIVQKDTGIFTDKMPLNLIHLGLINMLFPNAPIIHITRHPMDSCLSSYMANFGTGNRYTASLKEAATHYALVMDLTEHYKYVLDMRYLQVRYEDLISEPESRIRKILEFVDLPWEDACLKFYENKRVSKTASYAQVTQKIYTSSRFRYKNYYEHLQPLEPILHDVIQRFGYTFEP